MYFLQFLGLLGLFSLVSPVPPLQHVENSNKRREEFKENLPIDLYKLVEPKYKLPANTIPLSYNLYISPILDNEPEIGERFTAQGDVKIRVRCVEPTSVITFHSFLLTINHSSIAVTDVSSGDNLEVSEEVVYDEETHFYNITVSPPLAQNSEYTISILYLAPVSTNRTNGLYLTKYVDPISGEKRYQAMTQLEPTRARHVFPCFDEPGFKSIYSVSIGRKDNYTALANAPLLATTKMAGREGWVVDTFENTVPMPTYLFAMAVSDFTFEETNVFRVPVRSYGPKHWIDEGAGVYSAEASARTLQYFETHFNASYAMPKMDSIAVPGKGGAMENWGLVTYGNWLMYFNGVTTESERWSLDSVIAHELAHQWFGNLVTCKTWSNIWLNEGITTYVSYIGVEQESPEFEPRKFIVNDAHQSALIYDAGPNSHPMHHNANTTAEISQFFSTIVYDKGASIVRMMEGFLTETTLHQGLRNYLQTKVHDVAEQDELFEELTKQAHADGTLPSTTTVKEIMDTWTLKKGFPLLRVTKLDLQSIIISQEPFTNNYTGPQPNPEELWEVPISYATKLNPDFTDHTPKLWLHKNTTSLNSVHNTNEWILLNTDSTGFYRVLYDNYLTTLIQLQLQEDHRVISPLSRSQLIDDYFNLAFEGYIPIGNALPFLMHLNEEAEFTVWFTVFTNIRKTFRLISSTDAFNGFRSFLSPRLGASLENIGLEQQPEDKGALVRLRVLLLDWACTLGNSHCQEYISRLFDQWQSDPQINPIPIDIQQVVYCGGVAAGGETAFSFVSQRYMVENSTTQKSRLLSALTCTKQPELLNVLLTLALDPNSGLKKSDASSAITSTAANSVGRPLVLNFLENSTPAIIEFFGNANVISSAIQNLALYLGSQEELLRVTVYIENNRDALTDVMNSLNSSTTLIQENIQWMNKYYFPIKSWLDATT